MTTEQPPEQDRPEAASPAPRAEPGDASHPSGLEEVGAGEGAGEVDEVGELEEEGDEKAEETAGPSGADRGEAGRDADEQGEESGEQGEEPGEQIDWGLVAEEDPRSKAEVLAELDDAETARDEYLDDLRRARAEFSNFRKRMMREGASERDAGRAEVAEKLLDVLDDFDRTLEVAEESDDDSLARGVELVYSKLVDVLKALGLERIDEPGVPFDPNRHEAVQRVDAEEDRDEPVVDQVLRPGYEMADRVIRAAMVVVRQ